MHNEVNAQIRSDQWFLTLAELTPQWPPAITEIFEIGKNNILKCVFFRTLIYTFCHWNKRTMHRTSPETPILTPRTRMKNHRLEGWSFSAQQTRAFHFTNSSKIVRLKFIRRRHQQLEQALVTLISKFKSKNCKICWQGRNEARWCPEQEASLAPPCSNLKSFGSKCTVLKKVLATLLGLFSAPGNCASLSP